MHALLRSALLWDGLLVRFVIEKIKEMEKNQIGRIIISKEIFETIEILQIIYKSIVPIAIKDLGREVLIRGYSDQFKVIDEGSEIPYYFGIIENENITFEEVKTPAS